MSEDTKKFLESIDIKTRCTSYCDSKCEFDKEECKYNGICLKIDYWGVDLFCLRYMFPLAVLKRIRERHATEK